MFAQLLPLKAGFILSKRFSWVSSSVLIHYICANKNSSDPIDQLKNNFFGHYHSIMIIRQCEWPSILFILFIIINWNVDCQPDLVNVDCTDENFSLMNTLSLGIYHNEFYQYTLDHMIVIYPIRFFGKKIQLRTGKADYIYAINKGLLTSETFRKILEFKRNLIDFLSFATFQFEKVNFFQFIYLNRRNLEQTIMLTPITSFKQDLKPMESTYSVDKATKRILAIWMENNERMFFLDYYPYSQNDLVLINETKVESKKFVCIDSKATTMSFSHQKCPTKTNFIDLIRWAFTYKEFVYLVSISKKIVYYFEEKHLHSEDTNFELKQMHLMDLFSCSASDRPKNNVSWIYYMVIIILLLILFISAIFTIIYTLLIKRKSFDTSTSESSKQHYVKRISTPIKIPIMDKLSVRKDREMCVQINALQQKHITNIEINMPKFAKIFIK